MTRQNKISLVLAFAAILLLPACERDLNNPWDEFSNLSPKDWAPQNLQIEDVSLTRKKLTWTYNGDDRIEAFVIERKDEANDWQAIAPAISKDLREWTDEGILPVQGTHYYYRLFGKAGKNTSSEITIESVAIGIPAPTGVYFVLNNCNSVTIFWSFSLTGNDGFIIWRTDKSNNQIKVDTIAANIFSFTDNAIDLSDEKYSYEVFAFDGVSNSLKVKIETSVVEDIEGNQYQTTCIDGIIWMTENLKTTRYKDGTAINTGLSNADWQTDQQGACAVYPHTDVTGIDNEEQMIDAYGLLYNWNAVNNAKGLCPEGWSIPTVDDWTSLTEYLESGIEDAGNKLKSCKQENSPVGSPCATDVHPRWNANETHFGYDDFHFSALPAGIRYSNGNYLQIGERAGWWSLSQLGNENAWMTSIYSNFGNVIKNADEMKTGLSVRCVRNR